MSFNVHQFVRPPFGVEPIIIVARVEPRPQQARNANHRDVEPAQHPALDAMPVLVPHGRFLFRVHQYVLAQRNSSAEAPDEIELDIPKPMPLLPANIEQEQQPQQILRELPHIQEDFLELPSHDYIDTRKTNNVTAVEITAPNE